MSNTPTRRRFRIHLADGAVIDVDAVKCITSPNADISLVTATGEFAAEYTADEYTACFEQWFRNGEWVDAQVTAR